MKPDKCHSASRLFVICLAICLFVVSQHRLRAQDDRSVPPTGVIVDSVFCTGDSTESYCLYLPENYTASAEWPVVLIFDPGARGRVGIENFIPAGKKYGYILACSNNVRNGIFSTMLADAGFMYRDVMQKFTIDKRRIFTAGFSGGSRLAVGFAIHNKEISGVIGCGAGLPNSDEYAATRMLHLLYFGIVGIKDMNFLEMAGLNRNLTETGIPSYFLVFNGGHEWPSARNLEFALGWFELKLMTTGKIEKRDDFLNGFILRMIALGKEAETAKDLVSAKKYYEYAIRDFPDAPAVHDIRTSIAMIEINDSYTKSLEESKRSEDEELSKREKFERAITNMTVHQGNADSVISWWNHEIHLLKMNIESKRTGDFIMASRLLNLITSASIEYGGDLLSSGNYHSAAGFFTIWTICEPDKKFSWYNLARAYAFEGQNDRAVTTLQQSVIKGFTDKNFITHDPAFKSMRDDKNFIKLINDIQ
jgi:hypothetical protein